MTSDELLDSADQDHGLLQRVKGSVHQHSYGHHLTLEISVERGVVVIQGRRSPCEFPPQAIGLVTHIEKRRFL